MTSKPRDRAVHIVKRTVKRNGEVEFVVDRVALEKIFRVGDKRKLVVLSVAGAPRTGKSFLLNFLLRYLYARESGNEAVWLADKSTTLTGYFNWAWGEDPVTSGILMWNKLFPVELPNGETVAIALMDTQGTFANRSTNKENVTVFGSSLILSSVQVYNIFDTIREDHLQQLQLFLEYGKMVLGTCKVKAFQKLQFLVRDWRWSKVFGIEGGRNLLKNVFQDQGLPDEAKQIRLDINSCFASTNCFLLPHPGEEVSESEKFKGSVSEIKKIFIQHIKDFVHSVLLPENLVVKTDVNGSALQCDKFANYCEMYVKLLAELEPATWLEGSALYYIENGISTIMDALKTEIQRVVKEKRATKGKPCTTSELETILANERNKAINKLQSMNKFGGEKYADKYKVSLDEKLRNHFAVIRASNAVEIHKYEVEVRERNTRVVSKIAEEAGKEGKLLAEQYKFWFVNDKKRQRLQKKSEEELIAIKKQCLEDYKATRMPALQDDKVDDEDALFVGMLEKEIKDNRKKVKDDINTRLGNAKRNFTWLCCGRAGLLALAVGTALIAPPAAVAGGVALVITEIGLEVNDIGLF